jgi:hypothetical protein
MIFVRAIAYGLMPFVFALLASLFWISISMVNGTMKDVKDKILATVTIVLFLYYPTMF